MKLHKKHRANNINNHHKKSNTYNRRTLKTTPERHEKTACLGLLLLIFVFIIISCFFCLLFLHLFLVSHNVATNDRPCATTDIIISFFIDLRCQLLRWFSLARFCCCQKNEAVIVTDPTKPKTNLQLSNNPQLSALNSFQSILFKGHK